MYVILGRLLNGRKIEMMKKSILLGEKMKKTLTLFSIGVVGLALAGCGNNQNSDKEKESSSADSSSESNVDFKVAKTSKNISADNLSPQQTATLVMYYSGMKNNRSYVRQMLNKNQSVNIELYDITDASKVGVSNLPSNAQVIYKVSLKNGRGTAYYTIVGNDFYLANSRGEYSLKSITLDDMTKLANKNNAGDMIDKVASNAVLTDRRAESGQQSSASSTQNKSFSDPKLIGAMVLAKERGIDALAPNMDYMVGKDGYAVGLGLKANTMSYKIEGDKVTIKDGDLDYQTVDTTTISALKKEFYSNSSDKAKIDKAVSGMVVHN